MSPRTRCGKEKSGVANHFDWPAGTLAVKGSAEVAKAVKATPDAIGYVDYNDAVDENLVTVSMKNADGQFVSAGVEGFHEATMHSAWYATGDFSAELNAMKGARTWPITMGTYVAVPRVAAQSERTERALRFLTWSYLHGDALARQARFVPLPAKVQASAYREIAKVTSSSGELLGARLMVRLVD